MPQAITEFHTFAEAAKRSPRGVICLLSALRFHEIGTESPFEVWMAIGEKDRRPVSDNPRLRIVRFSKQSLDFGQTTQDIEGVPLRVFSVAKTVADCFKYRNKIGLDVATGSSPRIHRESQGIRGRSLAGRQSLPGGKRHEAVHGGSALKPANTRNIAASVRQKSLNIATGTGEDLASYLSAIHLSVCFTGPVNRASGISSS